jgi:hypothetical protein
MQQGSVNRFFATLDSDPGPVIPRPPPSGARLRGAAPPSAALRALADKAESLGLQLVAFELFFVAARLDETGRIDLARRDLHATALEVSEQEAPFYRRAARALGIGPSGQPSADP